MGMKDLTLLVCNYNTPDLVVNLLKSVKETFDELPKVVVMNTSTGAPTTLLDENEIPYYNFKGGIHGEAVNLGLKKVETRYVLLVDSDVIFKKDIKKYFEVFKERGFALMGNVVGDCAGKKLYPRVEPWFCFIDNQLLKNYKIPFFDRVRHMKRHTGEVSRIYDIGSTMFEDIGKLNKQVANVNIEDKYFVHYGGMSWRGQKYNPYDVDTDIDFGGTHPHKQLYDLAMRVKAQYQEDTKVLEEVDIKGIFK